MRLEPATSPSPVRRRIHYRRYITRVTESAGHENAGNENVGHEIAGHEITGHENAGHEIAGHEFAIHDKYRMKIYYITVQCAFLLNFKSCVYGECVLTWKTN